MTSTSTFRLALLASALMALSACSSDSDDPETPPTDGPQTPDPVTPPGGGDPDPERPVTGIDLTDMTPRVFVSQCGSLPVLDTAVSTAGGSPATLVEGELVRGSIEDDTAHFWQIELQAGYYHAVVDSAESNGRDINTGLTLRDVGGLIEPDEGGVLFSGNEAGLGTRLVAFFENSAPRTVTFELTPRFLGEDYEFGVFANGRDIPSPRFDDCPTITPLSLGDTQSPQFAEAGSASDQAWYRAELPAGDYTLDVTASRIDGGESNIIYEALLLDGFGQASQEEQLLDVSEVGVTSTDSATITRAEAGPVWLRLEAANAGLGIEFSLTAANGG